MKLTKNFSLSEFSCNDEQRTPVPDKYLANVQELAENLQILRDDLNLHRPTKAPPGVVITLPLNSAYRTKAYNKKVGGKPGSKHLTAEAGDITCKWETPNQLAARIETLIVSKKMKQGGLGVYPGFVHYDIRGTKARW